MPGVFQVSTRSTLDRRATNGVEVGQEVKRQAGTSLELGNNAKCRQRSELLVVFVRPLQLLLRCTDSQVVQDNVALGVAELDDLLRFLLGLCDDLGILGVCVRAIRARVATSVLVNVPEVLGDLKRGRCQ